MIQKSRERIKSRWTHKNLFLLVWILSHPAISQCLWDPGFISPFQLSPCVGDQNARLTLQILELDLNYTYQWKVSTSPNGAYTNVIHGTGGNTKTYRPPFTQHLIITGSKLRPGDVLL